MPIALLLHQWYSILSLVVLDADEDESPLHVMRTSSSLNMLTLSFMKTEIVQLSNVLPMLIRDVRKSWNVSACLKCADRLQKGS